MGAEMGAGLYRQASEGAVAMVACMNKLTEFKQSKQTTTNEAVTCAH
jgi:hypothetical protein